MSVNCINGFHGQSMQGIKGESFDLLQWTGKDTGQGFFHELLSDTDTVIRYVSILREVLSVSFQFLSENNY